MKRRGFTLLELILALGITVTVAGTLATVLYTAYRARAATQRAIIAARTTGLVTQIFSQDVENALPPNGILAAEFFGEIDKLSFYTTSPEPWAELPADIKRVEYELVPGADGTSDLVRRVTVNLLQTIEQEPPEEIICRGVTLLELSYFDGYAWQDTWDSNTTENTLPTAVRLVMEFIPSDGRTRILRCDRFIQLRCGNASSQESEEAS